MSNDLEFMSISAIADIHDNFFFQAKDCDVLIIAGDLFYYEELDGIDKFCRWLRGQKAGHKLVVAGNHDSRVFLNPEKRIDAIEKIKEAGGIYLEDETHVINGVRFYGIPWCEKRNKDKGTRGFWRNSQAMKEKANKIPLNTDILISHSPPRGILDLNFKNESCGSAALRERCEMFKYNENFKPMVNIFGHIHEEKQKFIVNKKNTYINCSCSEEWNVFHNKGVHFKYNIKEKLIDYASLEGCKQVEFK